MYLSAIDKRDRRQAAVDAQAALRHSKRRAYFDQRRHRESSLMYREPVFPEEAAVTLPVQEACRQASRKILFRPSWPNTVAIFSRYTPITDKDHLRMRVVG